MDKHKLSASALNTFLDSPKAFYWRYIARLEPIQNSVATYDHDKICGTVWSEFVNRFYEGMDEAENTKTALADWEERVDGWVPEKAKDRLTAALKSWSASYYQMFNPDDGIRGKGKSELFLENDNFQGYLDGLSDDNIVHEVKSTSRAPSLTEQMDKVGHSTQVKLYCVLADATGYRIEFAFKDAPYQLFRGPETPITDKQKKGWEQELNVLADFIYSLGDDEHNYPCHPDGCTIITKNFVGHCWCQMLCQEGLSEVTKYGYKEKTRRGDKK